MNKKTLFVLPILAALMMAGCGSGGDQPSSAEQNTSSEEATTTSVDPNANKRVTEALFTSEITNWGLFGLDRKVTATATNTYVSGTTTTITETTLKVDEVKHSAHRVTKTADGTVVNQSDGAYVLEKNQQDNKIYYKEIYVKGNDGKWSKNTNQQEFKFTNLYDLSFFADKLAYSSFTFDETSGTYKCASLNTTIYETPYLIENIEIAFENNKVKSISNKVSSQNPEVPGSSTVSVVFTNHGTTTVTLPDVKSSSELMSELFIDVGTQAAYIAGSKTRPTAKGLLVDGAPADRKMQMGTPAILLYLIGKLYEIEGFDCQNKVVSFRQVYDVANSGSTQTMDIALDLMIRIDKQNRDIFLYCNQDIIIGAMHITTPFYVSAKYDFDKSEVTSFRTYSTANMGEPVFYYFQYINGVGKVLDRDTKDAEYNEKYQIYSDAIDDFNARCESKTTVSDATLARKYGEAMIAANNFTNEIAELNQVYSFHEE